MTGTAPAWLTLEVRALYGVERDHVIAAKVGVTLGAVRWWRRVLGLPARGVGRPRVEMVSIDGGPVVPMPRDGIVLGGAR